MLTRPTGPLYMVLIFKKIQKSVKLHFQWKRDGNISLICWQANFDKIH